jgi:predicted Zn finger-like uncharacterized protein
MVNVECPGCQAPYSVAERRIPEGGLKMRCPKCGESFLVHKPGDPAAGGVGAPGPRPHVPTVVGHAAPVPQPAPQPAPLPAAVPPDRTLRSVGAPQPPASKAPLFPPANKAPLFRSQPVQVVSAPPASADVDTDFGDLDLPLPTHPARPAPKLAKASAADDADLPMAIDPDLPVAVVAELPVPAAPPGGGGEAPVDRGFGELDLPSLIKPRGFGEIDLGAPQPPEDGGVDLPVAAEADLPLARDDDRDGQRTAFAAPKHLGPFGAFVGAEIALDASEQASFADRQADELFAEPDLPPPEELPPPAKLRSLGADLPPPTTGEELSLPPLEELPPPAEMPLPPEPGEELSLPQQDSLDGDFLRDGTFPAPPNPDELAAAIGAPHPAAPPPRPAPPRPGGVGEEMDLDEGGGGTMERSAIALEAGAGAPLPPEFEDEAPLVPLKPKKSKKLRVALVALPVLAVAGGALTLTPLGPYGIHAISDVVNRGKNEQALASFREAARAKLSLDTASDAEALFGAARSEQQQRPRHAPMAAYAAYVAYWGSLRFGSHSEFEATAKQLVEGPALRQPSDLLELARAARDALEGRLDQAEGAATTLAARLAGDVDAAALVAEVALRSGKAKEAVALWEKAALVDRNARTLYGLARARLAAGDKEAAGKSAEEVLEKNKRHVGARLLLAAVRWRPAVRGGDEASIKLLEEVASQADVRGAASNHELVEAYSLLGEIHLARARMTAAEKAFAAALRIEPQAARALIGNGELFYLAGRYSEALARFDAVLRVRPDDVDALVGTAKTKTALERAKEAKDMLKALEAKGVKDPRVGYWVGKSDEALGDRKAAEAAYRKAIEVGGNDARVVEPYVALANIVAGRGDDQGANKILTEAAEKLPQQPALHVAKGDVALRSGRVDEAKAELLKALSLDPDHLASHFKLAIAYRRSREFDKAAAELDTVGKHDPEYPGLALERGLLFEGTGETKRALEMYASALQKAPDDLDLKLRVGSTQVMSGLAGQAVPLLRDVVQKRPSSAEANHFLGRALLLQNAPNEALKYLRNSARYDPNRAEFQVYLAWAANESGQAQDAEAAVRAALDLDRNNGDAYWQRAVLLQKRGQTLDALEDLRIALEKRPSRHEAYATMALCHQDQANYPAAEQAWRKAIDGNEEVPEWHFRLGKILFDRGARDEAAKHLVEAVEIVREANLPNAPGWLWHANLLLGDALRASNKDRAIEAYKEFLRQAPPENAYREDAKRALEQLGASPR